uniref:Uncharacterized protein n=1 Tax=Arundo donax TaxID=35708 RepID=A0A0A9A550_ARUDO
MHKLPRVKKAQRSDEFMEEESEAHSSGPYEYQPSFFE